MSAEEAQIQENGKGGGKGEKRERRDRGKGGGGKGGEGEGGKGKGGKERKPREKIPTFEDPEAELEKVEKGGEPPKPNRDNLDRKIQSVQSEIEANKSRVEQITKSLDGIKAKNEKLKSEGAGPQEKARETLRELKKQIVGVIEERKHISASIDKIREKKNQEQEAITKQKQRVGRFSSDEAINEEIKRIEDFMAHNSISIKEEKEYMNQIKDLNKRRDDVKALEELEGKRGTDGSKLSLPELFEARKKVDEKLDVLRNQEKAAVEVLNGLREKSQSKDSERFEKLLEERKGIREKISTLINQIREMRGEFQQADDKWFEYDRLVKNLKWQIRQKNIAKKEEDRKKWEEEKEKNKAAWEAEMQYRKDFNEDGTPKEKFMDFDIADKISQCEQLTVFLKKYLPQDEAAAAKPAAPAGGRTIEAPEGVKELSRDRMVDDVLGLNAFMVDEVVSKKSKKKDKKRKQNASKNDEMLLVAEGETVALQLSLDMIQQFATMGLSVPVNSDDAEESIKQLKEKQAYFQEKGDAGMSYKDLVKEEKAARNKKKGGGADKEEKEEPKEDVVKVAKEPVAPPEKKEGPDWLAEKIARKCATIEVDPDLDIAALRAKAQGAQMSDEEKKARGLLYDTSKASAVREDSEEDEDDEDADFAGGDPFDGL